MNKNNSTVLDRPATADIAKLLEDIDAVEAGHVRTLVEGDPFWRPKFAPVVRKASELISDDRVSELKKALADDALTITYVVDLYAVDGSTVNKRTVPGYTEAADEVPNGFFPIPNAVTRLGEHLIVTRGDYRLAGQAVVDGEDAFEFTSEYQIITEEEAADNKEFDDVWRPLVLAAQPSWSDLTDDTPVDAAEFRFEQDGTFRITVNSRDVFSEFNFTTDMATAYLTTTLVWNRTTKEFVSIDPVEAYVYVEEPNLQAQLTPVDIDTIATGLVEFAGWHRAALADHARLSK